MSISVITASEGRIGVWPLLTCRKYVWIKKLLKSPVSFVLELYNCVRLMCFPNHRHWDNNGFGPSLITSSRNWFSHAIEQTIMFNKHVRLFASRCQTCNTRHWLNTFDGRLQGVKHVTKNTRWPDVYEQLKFSIHELCCSREGLVLIEECFG